MSKLTLFIPALVAVMAIGTSSVEAQAGSCSSNGCSDVKISKVRVYANQNLITFKINAPVDTSYCETDTGYIWVESTYNQSEIYKTLLTLFLTQKPADLRLTYFMSGTTKVCKLKWIDLTTP